MLFPISLQKDLLGIKADTIVWSLDGMLRYVPIPALWDGNEYLVERYKNVVITLASRDRLAAVPQNRANWQALGVGVSRETVLKDSDGSLHSFEALTSVPEELCSVIADPDEKIRCAALNAGKNGIIPGKSLLDDKFTLANFKGLVGRYPIIHIASHFSLNAGNEDDSYLLLGGGDDRKLTLADVRKGGSKFVGVELLTLSACNTAMSSGNKSNGVEVEGFAVLAQNQGAKAVLASLWSVADNSTRDLMIAFYKQLEATPRVSKAEALQKAQLELLKGKYLPGEIAPWRRFDEKAISAESSFRPDPKAPFAHPYYWSPFVLMGNWQ
jgi:CHAT domain-containing protein